MANELVDGKTHGIHGKKATHPSFVGSDSVLLEEVLCIGAKNGTPYPVNTTPSDAF
jgi:hypothetical protein